MNKPKLLDCPFCGRSDRLIHDHRIEWDRHAIHCTYCGTIGPDTDYYESAISEWNTRAGGKK